jgi:hypothetical protein
MNTKLLTSLPYLTFLFLFSGTSVEIELGKLEEEEYKRNTPFFALDKLS